MLAFIRPESRNPVAGFVNGDMLQVLVIVVIVGVCCLSLKETTKEK